MEPGSQQDLIPGGGGSCYIYILHFLTAHSLLLPPICAPTLKKFPPKSSTSPLMLINICSLCTIGALT